MAIQSCRVTPTDVAGIRHAVEVSAESLLEARRAGVAVFSEAPWMDKVGLGTRLEVGGARPCRSHSVTMLQIQKWLQSGGNTPADVMRKKRVTALLRPERTPAHSG